jgi:murein DD-endopeptidase MepM/ murein hydrolase activator NlpD
MRKSRRRIQLKSRLQLPDPPKRKKKARRSLGLKGKLVIVGLLAAMVLINLWVFVWGRKSIPKIKNKASAAAIKQSAADSKASTFKRKGKSPLSLAVPKAIVDPESLKKKRGKGGTAGAGYGEMETRILHGRLRRGDNLYLAFKRLGVGRNLADAVVRALSPIFDFRRARPGQRFTLRISEDKKKLVDFEFQASPVKVYRVVRVGDRLVGKKVKRPVETRIVLIAARVKSSLHHAIKKAGGDAKLLSLLVRAFSWDINFYTDIHRGDIIKAVVEKDYLDGEFYRYGRLLAARYAGKSGTFEAYWYQAERGGVGYFDGAGKALKRRLLKTPLKYVRISSKFDRNRFHPVLHRHKAHLGVDFAAPSGTPVWAAADGTVSFVGRNRAAGNMVIINHADGMVTIYMHLLRFARGLKKGKEVRQRQVIGYVGTTGRSTGPHLHFGLKINGNYVDPLKRKARRAPPVPKRERRVFGKIVASFKKSMDALPVPMQGGATHKAPEHIYEAVDLLNRKVVRRKKKKRKSRRSRNARKQ